MRDYLLQFNVNLYPNTEFRNGFARVKESATGFMMIKRNDFTTIIDKFPNLKYKQHRSHTHGNALPMDRFHD